MSFTQLETNKEAIRRINACFHKFIFETHNRAPIPEEINVLKVLWLKVNGKYLDNKQVINLYTDMLNLCELILEGKLSLSQQKKLREVLEKKYYE